MGVFPGSWGVAQEEDGSIEGGEKSDEKRGSFHLPPLLFIILLPLFLFCVTNMYLN